MDLLAARKMTKNQVGEFKEAAVYQKADQAAAKNKGLECKPAIVYYFHRLPAFFNRTVACLSHITGTSSALRVPGLNFHCMKVSTAVASRF